jgi:methylmalonyl-CoA mutase cobalamin-binding subunit
MSYADSQGADGGASQIARMADRAPRQATPQHRYRSANSNQATASGDGLCGAPRIANAAAGTVGAWSAENFREQRAALRSIAALYAADGTACRRLAAAAMAEGGRLQQVARDLLGPAAAKIGRDWSSDDTNFLVVTMAMQRLQRLFHDLAAEDPPPVTRIPGRRLLLGPSPGDQHGFGLSIVEDAFQRAGWEVECCPDDDAGATLFRRAEEDHDVIGLSFGSDRTLSELQAIVAAMRQRAPAPRTRLMAGGRLALEHPQLLTAAGFDFVARDAVAAIRDAEHFVATGRQAPFAR